MQARKQLLTLIKPYLWRLLSVVLLNAVAIFFSILTFMLIEPFAKLIFKGRVDDLSVVGNWLMQGVALIIDIDNPLSSLTGIVVFVILLIVLKIFFFLAQVIMHRYVVILLENYEMKCTIRCLFCHYHSLVNRKKGILSLVPLTTHKK